MEMLNQSLPPRTCLLPENTLEQVIIYCRINQNKPLGSNLPEHLQRTINALRGDMTITDYLLAHDELKKYL
jgi:hypothetical protein